MSARYRTWCFTVNNWMEEDLEMIKEIPYNYIVVGKEIGENQTPHLQGYIELENAKSFKAIKKIFPEKTHLEPRKGTALQASDYCKKDGDYFEAGGMSKPQGFRSDLEGAIETIQTKRSLKAVAEEHPHTFIKFSKGLSQYFVASLPKRTDPPICYWFYGKSGTGKTREAYTYSTDIYSKNPDSKWWDGYEQNECVLLDDLRREHFPLTTLLRWFDRYPCQVEYKGGMMELNSKIMIVTSDEAPHHWYQGNDLEQLRRRFKKIKYFES